VRFFLILFIVSVFGTPVVVPSAEAATRLTAQERYDLGQRYLKRGYYTKALEQFNRIRNDYRSDPLALRAELAVGDVFFAQSEWDQARLSYQDFQRLHPQYEDSDYVVYRIGLCLWRKAPKIAARDQSSTRQAVDIWVGFDRRYPESEWRSEVESHLVEGRARLAKKELVIGRFYERRRAWRAVRGRIEGMLRQYPDSPDRAEGLYLLGQAYIHLGDAEGAKDCLQRLGELGEAGVEYRARLEALSTGD
jgi:outer membrane protein assembly factor BamD